MAKTTGLTCTVTVAGNDISNDILSFTVDTPYGEEDITGVDKSAVERLLLRADCTGTLNFAFNVAANRSHATLKTPGSKTFVLVYPGPATLSFTANTSNYALNIAATGELLGTCNYALNSGTAAAWT